MDQAFEATAFNGDISKWDVSSVSSMNLMFWRRQRSMAIFPNGMSLPSTACRVCSQATAFNGDISEWDVSSVTKHELMFKELTAFNGDISEWTSF
jgi:surface protein